MMTNALRRGISGRRTPILPPRPPPMAPRRERQLASALRDCTNIGTMSTWTAGHAEPPLVQRAMSRMTAAR